MPPPTKATALPIVCALTALPQALTCRPRPPPPPFPARQLRAEALGAALAAAAIITPSIEERLKELQPGRGRLAAAASVAGASSVFALQPGLADGTKQVGRGGVGGGRGATWDACPGWQEAWHGMD